MFLKHHKASRLDLQLIAMIGDAQEYLKSKGFDMKQKIFMSGFSASGGFSNRFALLHPEIVRAVASGGVGGTPILPIESYMGKKFTYPLGISDLSNIEGVSFRPDEYIKVSQYIFMGDSDTNTDVIKPDIFSDYSIRLVDTYLGKNSAERWESSKKIYQEQRIPAQMVTYRDVSHTLTVFAITDIVAFFRANDEEGMHEIVPTNAR